jgi:hypothetical protein
MIKNQDLSKFTVQPHPCHSCPFEGKDPVKLDPDRYTYFVGKLAGEGQHLCHSVKNKMICRGGRNLQLRILCSMGLLYEPTDECFDEAIEKYGKNRNEV